MKFSKVSLTKFQSYLVNDDIKFFLKAYKLYFLVVTNQDFSLTNVALC